MSRRRPEDSLHLDSSPATALGTYNKSGIARLYFLRTNIRGSLSPERILVSNRHANFKVGPQFPKLALNRVEHQGDPVFWNSRCRQFKKNIRKI